MAVDKRFLALSGLKNPEEYVICSYTFQTHQDVLEAAITLAKAQSTSSAGWGDTGDVEAEDDDIIGKFGAKLISYEVKDVSSIPDLPFAYIRTRNPTYTRAECKIAIPIRNFGYSIPALLTAAAGEIHYYEPYNSIKLMDIEFPDDFLDKFKGPQFGPHGLRKMLEITEDRPVIIAVVKPSLCPAKLFADLAYEALIGGADIVKDDELLADIPDSPLIDRVKLVVDAVKRAEKVTGKKKMYQFNITTNVSNLKNLFEIGRKHGGHCIMVNAMAIGLSATRMVRDFSDVPIASHFDLTACNAKVPFFGMSHKVIAKLHRLAGIDNLIMPAYASTYGEYEHDIDDEVKSCLLPLGNIKQTQPVFGGGVRAGNIAEILRTAKTTNCGLIIGHGIFAHPDGVAAGSTSIIQAWEAYREGISVWEYAQNKQELRRALEHFEGGHFLAQKEEALAKHS